MPVTCITQVLAAGEYTITVITACNEWAASLQGGSPLQYKNCLPLFCSFAIITDIAKTFTGFLEKRNK